MKKSEWNKITKDYYTEVLSPIKNAKKNPLFKDLKSIKKSNKKDIIDLGCGKGEILKLLSKQFNHVIGIDFSEEMIKQAREKAENLENVSLYVKDMKNLEEFKAKFDVAIAINSIISNKIKDIPIILEQIYNCLKKKGKFFAILPAMEVYLFESMLIADKEIKKGKNKRQARKKVRGEIKRSEHDFLLGTVNFEGEQKYFYRFEILWRLKKAGFKKIKIKKVLYSWKEFKEAGQEAFPKEEMLPWDWYVSAEK